MSGAFVVSNVLDALAPRSTIPMSTSSNGPGTGTGARASSRNGGAGRGADEMQASQDAALWPVKQRRRIDRIRDEKWGEFVKTINDQFEWLETYYQGCVVAANLQHKHQLENNGQQQHSQSGHPHLHPHPHQGQTDNPASWGATSSSLGYDPSIYTTPEQRRQHDFLSTPPARHPIFSTPLAASASLNATLFPGGRHPTTPDRHTRRTTHKSPRHSRSPFRRATTMTRATPPGSPLAALSPRRMIRITPRRLRVDVSASARKMGRERQARQHSMGLPQDLQHRATLRRSRSPDDIHSNAPSDTEAGGGKGARRLRAMEMDIDVGEESGLDLAPFSVNTPSKRPQPPRQQTEQQQQQQDQYHQQHLELKTPLNDTVAPPERMVTAPSSTKRSKSLLQSARTLETTIRSHRKEEPERAREPSLSAIKRSTPGSKARDSLGRVSPHLRALLRSGSEAAASRAGSGGGDHGVRAEPVPGLRRGNHATSASSSSASAMPIVHSAMKRDNSNLLEHDMTMQGDDGDNDGNDEDNQGGGHAGRHAFKRARRPSFHDSTAPVRFESPEKETNSKSSRLSLEEQRVFGSGRVSRTRTTGGSGYEADLSSSTTPDTMDMAMTTPEGATLSSAAAAASGKGRAVLDYEQGVHEYEEEDAGYDSRMSAATVVRSSETHRDTMRVSRIRPSLAESFEVMPSAEDGEFAGESSLASATTTTTATLRMTTTTSGGANYQQQQQQQQRQRDPSTVISSTSRLNTLKKLGRSTSTSASTSSAPLTTSMDDEATDFHDLHTDLPPPSTVTNYLRQGRSVSSTDLLSSTSSGAAGRGGGIFSRVSNLNLKPGGLKRTVSAMEGSHSTLGGSSTMGTGGSSNSGGNVGSTGGALTQLKPRHFPLSLAEKRPLGSRRPMMAGSAGSSTSQLMSRLLKSGPGLASSAVTAADVGRVSSALQQQQSNSSAVGTATVSVRSSTVGSSATNVASIPRSTTPVPPSSSSSSSSSTLMRPTESSLARAAELQSAKRSMLGGSTAVVSSSSSMSLSNSSSVKSKAPNPSMAPGLNRPQHPKAKTVAPLAPPPPPAAQPMVLPDIGSDVEDHDQDGDDPFPPKSSIVTVVTTTKGATSAASSSTTNSRKNAVAGSSVTSFTSSASASLSSKLPGASKSKSFTNKDASALSTTIASSTTTSSKLKVEKAKAKPTKATTSTLPRAAATTTTTAATTTTTTTATTTTTTNGSSSASSSSSSREPPEWAQWNRLEEAMHQQRHVNPRLIFGSLPVLDMNDMFPGNEAKFRARSSSAHWGNADRLTESEAQKYREEMGWE